MTIDSFGIDNWRQKKDYLFSRLAADALAADLSSFSRLSLFLRLTAFFADVRFFTGFTFGDLVDFFTIVGRN
jgi:hypothetical protein